MDNLQPSDPIEELLRRNISANEAALRQHLLDKTMRLLRRRRWRNRVALTGVMAACFLAGAAVVVLWPREKPQPETAPPLVKDQVPAISPALAGAIAKEWRAFDDPAKPAELYRQAGDLYVEEAQDFESALRCYTQALDKSPEQDLAISSEDNWLLMALKNARRKEKSHAKNGG